MSKFNFALKDYSTPLFWGNCRGHFREAWKGSIGNRIVHASLFLLLLLPGFSQIGSLAEKTIVECFSDFHKKRSLLGKNIVKKSDVNLPPVPGTILPLIITPSTLKDSGFQLSYHDRQIFKNIDSGKLVPLNGKSHRSNFMDAVKSSWLQLKWPKWPLKPVIISQSEFVPKSMAAHLMRNKRDSAIGKKYEPNSRITNMEGAMHSFITGVLPITMSGDYVYTNEHGIKFLNGQGREVILSTAIQPDFENSGDDEVVMKLIEVKTNALEGKQLPDYFQPLWKQSKGYQETFSSNLKDYEEQLQKHMIYHLTASHGLPSLSEIESNIMSKNRALEALEGLIRHKEKPLDLGTCLKDSYVEINEHVISLEALWNFYVHQLRNEFSVLEKTLPQGYIYIINPPSIFAKQIGQENVDLLNRLQILAFKHLTQKTTFNHLKVVAFSDYSDKNAIDLLKNVFSDKTVISKEALFSNSSPNLEKKYALVLHNNSDAFGQNIETEGPTSLDGVIGSYSDAACHLQRNRADLLLHVD